MKLTPENISEIADAVKCYDGYEDGQLERLQYQHEHLKDKFTTLLSTLVEKEVITITEIQNF